MLKFSRPEHKLLLVHETAFRLHATQYEQQQASSAQPSFFVMKLRKYLRDRRVTAFEQVGFDRVVRFVFGHDKDPALHYSLYVELYAAGNMILTDSEDTVLLLQRVVQRDVDGVRENVLAAGTKYVPAAQQLALDVQELHSALETRGRTSVRTVLKKTLLLFSPAMIEHCCVAAAHLDTSNDPVPAVIAQCQALITTINERLGSPTRSPDTSAPSRAAPTSTTTLHPSALPTLPAPSPFPPSMRPSTSFFQAR